VGVCVFWNKTLQEWSSQGCQTLTGSGNMTRCVCSHLTDFTATTSIVDRLVTTFSKYREIDLAYLRKNWGVVLAVVLFYGGFLGAGAAATGTHTRELLLPEVRLTSPTTGADGLCRGDCRPVSV
jgi:hypothetical protein